ncbi:MAG: type II toxin-antitoxin system RelE/ParE family toxin [Magnetococcus sp. YQC-9]
MNRYRVRITPTAGENLRQAHDWLKEKNSGYAARWLRMMRRAILELATLPESHALAPEEATIGAQIRRKLTGRGTPWRIYFVLREQTVYVLHVRHGRQDDWQMEALEVKDDDEP